MNKLMLSAVFVSCLAGCNPVYENMAIDYKYTPQELAIIHLAFNEWEKATGSEEAHISHMENMFIDDNVFNDDDFHSNFGMAVMHKVSRSDPGFSLLVDEFDNKVAGVGREGEMIITVTESYTRSDGSLKEDWLKTILIHELGHFYGLDHGDGLLMVPAGAPNCIDQLTVDSYCEEHGDCVNPRNSCD